MNMNTQPFLAQLQITPGTLLTYKNAIAQDQPVSKISFRIDPKQTATIATQLEELYKSIFPLETFNWVFLDQNIRRNYAQEQITRNQIILFTFLAIGIACLGLLGTTSNKVVEKTKEIGIRKILGAHLHQIALLIINTSLKQLLVSIVIGIPLAYLLVEKYQERYSERMTFSWWHYALPVALLVVIMILTIAGVLMKAARTNPVGDFAERITEKKTSMLLNYLKLAIRLFIRNPFFSIIVGGSVGWVTAFFDSRQHSQHEMKSDRFHRRWQDIVRLNFHVNDGVFQPEKIAVIHPAFTRRIATSLPELSDHTRSGFQNQFNTAFPAIMARRFPLRTSTHETRKLHSRRIKLVYADQNIFDFFTIEILSGDRETFLNEPNCIVLSDELAHKYFANEPAVGATLLLNDSLPLSVTAFQEPARKLAPGFRSSTANQKN